MPSFKNAKANCVANSSDTAVFVVGDIHGCFEDYLQLEEVLQERASDLGKRAFIVSVGDLIDRGRSSAEVVRHFRVGTAAGTHAAIGGNHEAYLLEMLHIFRPDIFTEAIAQLPYGFPMCVQTLEERYKRRSADAINMSLDVFSQRMLIGWLRQGGSETLRSFGTEDPLDPAAWTFSLEDLRYLASLPVLWENDQCVVTHALASTENCEYARKIQADRKFDPTSHEHFEHLEGIIWNRHAHAKRPDPMRWHVSGHTPLEQAKTYIESGCLMIDTGCVYGNELTAWSAEENEFIAVLSSIRHP